MKTFYFLIFLFYSSFSFCQIDDTVKVYNYDPSFQIYLNELKITCINKDTLKLHKLFGENAFGYSCYGLESPDRNFDSDWLIFTHYFGLAYNPNESKFWDLFLKISENGFHFDNKLDTYELPASHYWKGPYLSEAPKFGVDDKVFISDTVEILIGNHISTSTKHKINATEIIENKIYPYRFEFVNDNYYLCFENEKAIGFISKDDLIYWNFHLSFRKINNNWTLIYYEVCD
ncbi:MAG: hypothetical protein KA734_11445 [Fluviicola sp.]|nr:hypothetical protein [Fluviicola sp.]